jgi:nucleotide-binding universal stress UspA family protein
MKRVHLYLRPDTAAPAPAALIEYACALARAFDASLSVTSPRLAVRAPSHWLAGATFAGMARDIERNAKARAVEIDAAIRANAARRGLAVEIDEITEQWPLSPQEAVWRGRPSDLCILGATPHSDEQRVTVESWLFGSGRPCLLYPEQDAPSFATDIVLVAWDFSKMAARAVGDALPFLRRSKETILLTVRGEKTLDQAATAEPMLKYLAAHGVQARVLETQLSGRKIGQAILSEARSTKANLLVMGAFGHSRLQEFVLGGATKEILDASSMPILMSH